MIVLGYKQDTQKLLFEKNALNLGKETEHEFEPVKASIMKYGQHFLAESKDGDLFIIPITTYNNMLQKLKLPGISKYSELQKQGYLK